MPQADLSEVVQGAASPPIVLMPFSFWTGGASSSAPHLSAAMAAHFVELGLRQAEPLRWAITALDPQHGLQLEGIVLAAAPAAAESAGEAPTSPGAEPGVS